MRAVIAKAKHFFQPMKVEVLCGDIRSFLERLHREVGIIPSESLRGDAAVDPKPVFAGVPVVENDLLPSNMAVVKLNGEVVQVIRFD